jgi:hypothetical protein
MAGMNLGMSERNDTIAAHRSVVAFSRFELGQKQDHWWTPCFHALRKELIRPAVVAVIVAATHALHA